jgi:hypothetical protein
MKQLFYLISITIIGWACTNSTDITGSKIDSISNISSQSYIEKNLAGYAKVKLTADLSKLSEKEKQMIPLLIQASQIMDDLYWQQSFGNKDSLLNTIADDRTKQFVLLNYGPWDKLNNDTPFIAGVGIKPPGANFYPKDITKKELESSGVADKN